MNTKVEHFLEKAKDYFILADFIESRAVPLRRKMRKRLDLSRLFSDYQGASRWKKAYEESK